MPEFKAIIDDTEDWDFKKTDTTYLTHGLHPYPAKMIPQISKRLLKKYAKKGDLILDPFCGSGGVLVEARLANMNSIGIDLNPLACLISEIKSNPIDPDEISKYWKTMKSELSTQIAKFNFGEYEVEPPDFYEENILYWFKLKTIKELTIIRNIIKKIGNRRVRRTFDVAFSKTIRKVSGTRKNEFKLYRMKIEDWNKYNPSTFKIFLEYTEDIIDRMNQYWKTANHQVYSKIYLANSQDIFTPNFPEEANRILEDTPPSTIITSPPYGDHSTTVAYGQFSRYSSLWLNFEEEFEKDVIWQVDNEGLGGRDKKVPELNYEYLNKTVEKIREKDDKRAKEAQVFFYDLFLCLEKMYDVLAEEGHVCIVVSNRSMKRVRIPTQLIIAEMGVDIGFNKNVIFYPRKIPSKRLPWKNAPENITGLNEKTMSNENIIILKK